MHNLDLNFFHHTRKERNLLWQIYSPYLCNVVRHAGSSLQRASAVERSFSLSLSVTSHSLPPEGKGRQLHFLLRASTHNIPFGNVSLYSLNDGKEQEAGAKAKNLASHYVKKNTLEGTWASDYTENKLLRNSFWKPSPKHYTSKKLNIQKEKNSVAVEHFSYPLWRERFLIT